MQRARRTSPECRPPPSTPTTLQAAVHVVARAETIHGTLNSANGRHSMHPPARGTNPNIPSAPPRPRAKVVRAIVCARHQMSDSSRERGWPRALDFAHPSCHCSDCFCTTFMAFIPLHSSQCTSQFTVSAGQCLHLSLYTTGNASNISRVCHGIQNN
jgi:hypothetical protein